MAELKFVLKTFLFTCALVVLMQVKVGGATLESYSLRWLQHSSVSQWVQSAAAGGAMALRNLAHHVKEGVASTVDGFHEGSHEKAVR